MGCGDLTELEMKSQVAIEQACPVSAIADCRISLTVACSVVTSDWAAAASRAASPSIAPRNS